MLYLAGIIITLFLATLLAGKRNKNAGDRILALWLLVVAGHLTLYYLFISGKILEFDHLLGIHLPYPLLHGPFLFLYTASLTGQLHRKKFLRLLHFLPFIIAFIPMVPFFALSPAEKIAVFQNRGAGYETYMALLVWAIIFSGVVYISASLFLLRKYRKALENEFSNTEKINLAWLRYLIYGLAVIWVFVIWGKDNMVFGISVLYVFLLGFFGIRQVGIFSNSPVKDTAYPYPAGDKVEISVNEGDNELPRDTHEEGTAEAARAKYERSGLGTGQADTIYEQLNRAMQNEKIFTNPELTLAGLAAHLAVHPNHLSQVINSFEGKNFYDYINFHRIEEFKRIAPKPENAGFTLLSIAYEAGFNSKTSFNRNFKRVTGISPTEYLQQQHIRLQ